MPIISYTPAEYRGIADPIANEGGWALEDNPNKRYYSTRSGWPILMVCMHITDGIADFTPPDLSAESTAQYGMTTTNQASWHVVIDSDSIIPCLQDSRSAWAQGVTGYQFNNPGLGVEIATKGTDWRTKPAWWVEQALRNVAVWLAPRVVRYNIPLRVERDRDAVQAKILARQPVGFTNHGDLDPNNRTDPGIVGALRIDTFPWEQLFGYIREEIEGGAVVERVLKLGVRGEDVRAWQQVLIDVGYDPGPADGVFGSLTDTATKQFQTYRNLVVDGVVGANTRKAMDEFMSEILNAINQVASNVSNLAQEVNTVKGQVTTIRSRVDAVATEVAAVKQSSALNGQNTETVRMLMVQQHQDIMGRLNEAPGDLDDTLAQVADQVGVLGAMVVNLDANLTEIKDGVNKINEGSFRTFLNGYLNRA